MCSGICLPLKQYHTPSNSYLHHINKWSANVYSYCWNILVPTKTFSNKSNNPQATQTLFQRAEYLHVSTRNIVNFLQRLKHHFMSTTLGKSSHFYNILKTSSRVFSPLNIVTCLQRMKYRQVSTTLGISPLALKAWNTNRRVSNASQSHFLRVSCLRKAIVYCSVFLYRDVQTFFVNALVAVFLN